LPLPLSLSHSPSHPKTNSHDNMQRIKSKTIITKGLPPEPKKSILPPKPSLSSGEHPLPAAEEPLPYYHKRAFAHNYRAPFIYHIILKKREGVTSFGAVRGDARIAPGEPGCAFVEETELGRSIAKSILRLQVQFPILQIYQFMVMPDHVHILLRVKEWLEKHLDFYVEDLVSDVGKHYSAKVGTRIEGKDIFQPGYCDKPLLLQRSLDGLFRYIRENPHRLAMRRQFPQFFRRIRRLKIGDEEYEAYGNLFLFRNPDKEAVKISRRFSDEEKVSKRYVWLNSAANGTVLVSPFISKEEKEIRARAETLGAKIILITHEAFSEHYKPAARDFALCSEGRLLIISLGLPAGTNLSRAHCLQMNEMAGRIVEEF
ncbi:MAG: hypothetical protein K2H86_04085, partial [Muribaculaceae bacterium]|nr:hypothetical protein [Muribaculaceae bacterium]